MAKKDLADVRVLFKQRDVMHVKYSLVLMDPQSGAFNFHHGVVEDRKQLTAFKKAMVNVKKSEIEYTSVSMGKVDCFFDNERAISIEPVFHPSHDTYRDLLYVDGILCSMSQTIRELLELWRKS